MTLDEEQLRSFHSAGHLTVAGLFSDERMREAIDDAHDWGDQTIEQMDADQRRWYLESGGESPLLRKLDNPVYHREVFRRLAAEVTLLEMVEQLVGQGVRVFFSQVFFKPPERGGPKPAHQDNFYFGPSSDDAMVTAWIALDEATLANGCLHFAEGSQSDGKLPHVAPEDEPFNLQLPAEVSQRYPMTPAPVPRGGVSFHHGLTHHQSSSNTSQRWRRAVAIHYLNNDERLVTPQLTFDESVVVKMS